MLVVGLSASQGKRVPNEFSDILILIFANLDNGQFTSLLAKWTLEEKGQNDAPSARAVSSLKISLAMHYLLTTRLIRRV